MNYFIFTICFGWSFAVSFWDFKPKKKEKKDESIFSSLFDNYYMIDIYGLSIKECKNLSLLVGNLIGKNVYVTGQKSSNFDKFNISEDGKETWQIMFKQYTNPQAIEYMDIKRVGYNATLQCIINKVYEKEEE